MLNENENLSNGKVRLGGLWVNETKGGEKYFGGTFGPEARICIFKNKYRRNDNDPEYEIFLMPSGGNAQAPRNDQNGNAQKTQQQNRTSQQQKPQPKKEEEQKQKQKQQQDAEEELFWKNLEDDELPFDN